VTHEVTQGVLRLVRHFPVFLKCLLLRKPPFCSVASPNFAEFAEPVVDLAKKANLSNRSGLLIVSARLRANS